MKTIDMASKVSTGHHMTVIFKNGSERYFIHGHIERIVPAPELLKLGAKPVEKPVIDSWYRLDTGKSVSSRVRRSASAAMYNAGVEKEYREVLADHYCDHYENWPPKGRCEHGCRPSHDFMKQKRLRTKLLRRFAAMQGLPFGKRTHKAGRVSK